jgi:hypothetical protein
MHVDLIIQGFGNNPAPILSSFSSVSKYSVPGIYCPKTQMTALFSTIQNMPMNLESEYQDTLAKPFT